MSQSTSNGRKVAIAGAFATLIICLLVSLGTSAVSIHMEDQATQELKAKAAKAPKILSAIISYVEKYKQDHDGKCPSQHCDTESLNDEWIDNIARESKHFTFFYAVDFAGNIYAGAEGKAEPFSSDDTLTFYFTKGESMRNIWQATGKLRLVKPNQAI